MQNAYVNPYRNKSYLGFRVIVRIQKGPDIEDPAVTVIQLQGKTCLKTMAVKYKQR